MSKIKVDLHIHTTASFDSSIHPAKISQQAKGKGLDRICITDHNSTNGARLAKRLAPEFVIIGEEIATTHGEILAFFVEESVPPHLSPQETIARLQDQGAVISLSHPFDAHRPHWSAEMLATILPTIDAIEGFNARSRHQRFNQLAMDFATSHQLPITAGSDAHTARELGRAYLEMPAFTTAAEFRVSLSQATMHGQMSPLWVHLYSTLNRMLKQLGLQRQFKS